MADEKKTESKPAPVEEKPKKKGKLKILMAIGGVMALEGVGVFYAANMMSSAPTAASASDDDGLTDKPADSASHDGGKDEHAAKDDHAKKDEHAKKSEDAEHKKDAHGSEEKKDEGHGKSEHGKSEKEAPKKDAHEAHGGEHDSKNSAATKEMPVSPDGLKEIDVADSRLHNVRSGRSMIVRIKVSILVSASNAEEIKSTLDFKKSRVQERVCAVVRNAEPKSLDEPGLETLKRQLRHELSQVIGDNDIIKDVLVPELLHD